VSDIVERLRSVGRDYDFHENAYIYEAANEIERLRAVLRKIADGKRDADQSYATLFAEVVREARAALSDAPAPKGGKDE
jgi:hypothetical protein